MGNQAGILLGLIYVLLKMPFWSLAIIASDYHDLVWGSPELFESPYSPYVGPSLTLAEGMSIMAVVWVSVFGVMACAIGNRHGRWYLFAGLFDAILVSGLLTAAYLQSTFLPKPLGHCWNAEIWPYNQTYNTSAPTLFEVLAGNFTEAGDQCSDLVTIWELEISMGIMLSVTCLVAWTMTARSFFFLPHGHPHRPSGPLGADILVVLELFHILFRSCLLDPICWLMQPLLVKVISVFRYWFRYREKKQSLGYSKGYAMDSYPKDNKDLDGPKDTPIFTIVELDSTLQMFEERKQSIMEIALSHYSPILKSITTGLHYEDTANLKLVSKTICNALAANSPEALRISSCVNGTKSECWSCRKQICRDCKKSRKLTNPTTTQHLNTCELVCSKCFYKSCCNSEISKGDLIPRPTACLGHDSDWRTRRTATNRELCKSCSLLHLEGILAIRGRREEKELAQVSELSNKCGKCKKLVDATGPRWWLCTICSKECTERYHSAWRLNEDV